VDQHDTPEGAWKSLNEREDKTMDMKATTAQLCVQARRYETENVWAYRMAVAALIAFAACFAYFGHKVVVGAAPWISFGQAWLMGAMCFLTWNVVRKGPRQFHANEACASFLVREMEGKRGMMKDGRRALFLAIPALAAGWWGSGKALPFLGAGLLLSLIWFALGREAARLDHVIENLRRDSTP
jgi:hypothetical protein